MKKGFTLIELMVCVGLAMVAFIIVLGVIGAVRDYKPANNVSKISTPVVHQEIFNSGDIVYIDKLNVTGVVSQVFGYISSENKNYTIIVKSGNGIFSLSDVDGSLLKRIEPVIQLEK